VGIGTWEKKSPAGSRDRALVEGFWGLSPTEAETLSTNGRGILTFHGINNQMCPFLTSLFIPRHTLPPEKTPRICANPKIRIGEVAMCSRVPTRGPWLRHYQSYSFRVSAVSFIALCWNSSLVSSDAQAIYDVIPDSIDVVNGECYDLGLGLLCSWRKG